MRDRNFEVNPPMDRPLLIACRQQRPIPTPPSPRGLNAGFSLVELVVALGIGAMLVAVAVPSWGWWIGNEQVMNHAMLFAKSMQLARSEAIKRGHRVNLCKSADGIQCADTGGWDQGFLMHEDTGTKGEVDGDDVVIRIEPPTRGIHVASNKPLADYVSFTAFGHARMLNGALQMGTFTVCKPGFRAVDVVLVGSGRVRIAKTKTICP
jgi:type IV fimbrial biogenesis protein FimT